VTHGRRLLREAGSVLRDGLARNTLGRFRALDPIVAQVNVNARCNARCAMCNIWRTEDPPELDLDRYAAIFADPLFRSIEYLNLAGGEPTLRRDLPEIAALALAAMPRLRQISIPTSGLATDRALRLFATIARDCDQRGVELSIGVSLDGIGASYDRVRGVPGGDAKVLETLTALKKLAQDVELRLTLNPTLTAANVADAPALRRVGTELDVDVRFIIGVFLDSYFRNAALRESLAIADEDLAFLRRFLREEIEREPWISKQAYYYEHALAMLAGARRAMPCPYQDRGLVLEADGTISYCIASRSLGDTHQRAPSDIYRDPENLAFRRDLVERTCGGCQVSCFVGVGLRSAPAALAAHVARRIAGRTRSARVEPTAPETGRGA